MPAESRPPHFEPVESESTRSAAAMASTRLESAVAAGHSAAHPARETDAIGRDRPQRVLGRTRAALNRSSSTGLDHRSQPA